MKATDNDPIGAVIVAQESALRQRLLAGGVLVAMDADDVVMEYRRLASALRSAAELTPPGADLTDDPLGFTLEALRTQLALDAETLASNAETRAANLQRTMATLWKGRLDAERAKARWARIHAAQMGGH